MSSAENPYSLLWITSDANTRIRSYIVQNKQRRLSFVTHVRNCFNSQKIHTFIMTLMKTLYDIFRFVHANLPAILYTRVPHFIRSIMLPMNPDWIQAITNWKFGHVNPTILLPFASLQKKSGSCGSSFSYQLIHAANQSATIEGWTLNL